MIAGEYFALIPSGAFFNWMKKLLNLTWLIEWWSLYFNLKML